MCECVALESGLRSTSRKGDNVLALCVIEGYDSSFWVEDLLVKTPSFSILVEMAQIRAAGPQK